MMRLEILPSLLAADKGRLGEEIARAASCGADQLHIDIMDPNFVPNISYGPWVVALAKQVAPAFKRNVHLMLTRPDRIVKSFVEAGADSIQIHIESDCDLHVELRKIRELGVKNAIVLNPETPVEKLLPYLGEVDGVMVMTVHPGYGGQKFIAECLPKLTWLRERAPALDIMIDGGGNRETIVASAKAGANQFVAGNYLFSQPDMKAAVEDLRRALNA